MSAAEGYRCGKSLLLPAQADKGQPLLTIGQYFVSSDEFYNLAAAEGWRVLAGYETEFQEPALPVVQLVIRIGDGYACALQIADSASNVSCGHVVARVVVEEDDEDASPKPKSGDESPHSEVSHYV